MIASSLVSNSNLVPAHVHQAVIACLCGTIPGFVCGILLSRWNEVIRSWNPAYLSLIYVFALAVAALIQYLNPMVEQAVGNGSLPNFFTLLIAMMTVWTSFTFCTVVQESGRIFSLAVYTYLSLIYGFALVVSALIQYWKPIVKPAVGKPCLPNFSTLFIAMMAVSTSLTHCAVVQESGRIFGFAVYMPLPFLFWTLQIQYCNWKQISWRPFNSTFWMVSLVLSFLSRVFNEQVATGTIQMESLWQHIVDLFDLIVLWHFLAYEVMHTVRRYSQPDPERAGDMDHEKPEEQVQQAI
jgi:hypothetical protein